jgi:hypothetical protein
VRVPAVITAGEGRASKAICGQSKVYLEVGGRPLVARVVSILQRVPEVSEIWVVGNAPRLEGVLDDPRLRGELRVPVTIVPQFRNLYENAWQTYRRLLPAAVPRRIPPRPSARSCSSRRTSPSPPPRRSPISSGGGRRSAATTRSGW